MRVFRLMSMGVAAAWFVGAGDHLELRDSSHIVRKDIPG